MGGIKTQFYLDPFLYNIDRNREVL